MNLYEIRPRRDRQGVNLISDKLPFGSMWYGEPNAVENAAGYAVFNTGAHSATITIFDSGGVVIDVRSSSGIDAPNVLGRI